MMMILMMMIDIGELTKSKKKSAQLSYRVITIIEGAKNDDDDHDIGDVTKNEKSHFCKFSYPVITINDQFDENEGGW